MGTTPTNPPPDPTGNPHPPKNPPPVPAAEPVKEKGSGLLNEPASDKAIEEYKKHHGIL